ncbi:L-dopachrome tautomerase-related protein [Brenneria goodwinii]|uniref:L-dopachrome tautomerase-related protein n=1 Tax=Brenneria goodwinii TaxID=1109412 RepID=UPI0036EE54DE
MHTKRYVRPESIYVQPGGKLADIFNNGAARRGKKYRSAFFAGALLAFGMSPAVEASERKSLETVVAGPYQINGIAVAQDGRVFVGMPRWIQQNSFSVGVVVNGEVKPYPGDSWNQWTPQSDPTRHFVSINALRIEPDKPDHLWAVDCTQGNGGAKLIDIDIRKNQVARVYPLDTSIVPVPDGCLNDVRIVDQTAFLTESGAGAIITLDLTNGQARRLLAGSQKTKAVPGKAAVIDGVAVKTPEGGIPLVHADGIEISPDKQWLYFCTPMGGNLWRVRLSDLLDSQLDDAALDQRVENLGPLMPVGGILMLPSGDLLLSDVEHHAIQLRRPDGTLRQVAASSLLDWPDAMAIGPDGKVYTGAPQANRTPDNNGGRDDTRPPFRVLRFALP